VRFECHCQLDARLDAVAVECEQDGSRFTGLRREVLGLVLQADGPVGAYGLLDRLRLSRAGAAPPTIYRALSFLVAKGLIHRVERPNAFVACTAAHRHETPAHLLICRACGQVTEIGDGPLSDQLTSSAEAAGLTTLATTVELEGICRRCTGSSVSVRCGTSGRKNRPASGKLAIR
jgi:Fur family zinc uptake transcriptional regulator